MTGSILEHCGLSAILPSLKLLQSRHLVPKIVYIDHRKYIVAPELVSLTVGLFSMQFQEGL
jgi:hypothetical protein